MIAAIAAEHSCTVATLDRDFARFPSVPHKLELLAAQGCYVNLLAAQLDTER